MKRRLTYSFWGQAEIVRTIFHFNSIIPVGLLLILSLSLVFFSTYNNVKAFDDEGTLLITFRELMQGRILYHDLFALYGPFYYLVVGPIFSVLHVPLSHDAARLVSAVFWVSCSATFASIVWRLTRSTLAAAFALLTALLVLKLFVHSPLHPQELSFLLIGCLLHLVISIERAARPAMLFLLGAIVAGLLLTKVNVAAFVILPLLLAALRTTRGRFGFIQVIVWVLGVMMPVVLMAPLLHMEWVVRYCIFATATIFASLIVFSSVSLPEIFAIRAWGVFLAGFTAMTLLTISATIAGGTSAFEIFHALVLQNFYLIRNWHFEVPITDGALVIAAVSMGYAVYFVRSQGDTKRREVALAQVRRLKVGLGILGVAAFAIAALFGTPWEIVPPLMFQFLVPFAWLIMVADDNDERAHTWSRAICGVMAAFLVLYAFPVHGTQTTLASFLPMVMLSLLLSDAIKSVHWVTFRRIIEPANSSLRRPHAIIAYTVMLSMLASQTFFEGRRYWSMESLGLPGASWIRVEPSTMHLYHWATGALRKCSAFYLIPSLPSFYFWAEQKPPTGIMSNNTFGLLSPDQQRGAIEDLDRYPQLCILTIPVLLETFDRGQLATRPPLLEYVQRDFVETESNGPFRLLQRKRQQ